MKAMDMDALNEAFNKAADKVASAYYHTKFGRFFGEGEIQVLQSKIQMIETKGGEMHTVVAGGNGFAYWNRFDTEEEKQGRIDQLNKKIDKISNFMGLNHG